MRLMWAAAAAADAVVLLLSEREMGRELVQPNRYTTKKETEEQEGNRDSGTFGKHMNE